VREEIKKMAAGADIADASIISKLLYQERNRESRFLMGDYKRGLDFTNC
jgi:hypothetical protein